MSDINFCNTKEQLNHLGEVVTGKVDGSPTGADIDTSTLPYTGQVRKTLPALEGEYEQSITNKESEADAAIDSYRLLNKGPYASGIALESKFEFITYNGESYFATNPPYTTTATTPDNDANLFLGGYTTFENVANKIGNKNELSNSNFLTPSPDAITHPNATPESYAAGTQIFSGVYAGDSGCTVTLIDGRVNCTAGDYQFKLSNTGGLEHVPVLASSVSDYDGIPKTTGVSHALVGNEYVVTVTPAAGDVFSAKLEQGGVATRHEVIDNIGDIHSPYVITTKKNTLQQAVDEAVKRKYDDYKQINGSSNSASVVIDLGGQAGLIDRPIELPAGAGGYTFKNGLIAPDPVNFPVGESLIEYSGVGDHPLIGYENLQLECGRIANGMYVNQYIENWASGLRIHGQRDWGIRIGSDLGFEFNMAPGCTISEYYNNETGFLNPTSTGLLIDVGGAADNKFNALVVKYCKRQFDIGSQANKFIGCHFYGTGVDQYNSNGRSIIRGNAKRNQFNGTYLDTCGLEIQNPSQMQFLGGRFAAASSVDSSSYILLNALTANHNMDALLIKDNIFSIIGDYQADAFSWQGTLGRIRDSEVCNNSTDLQGDVGDNPSIKMHSTKAYRRVTASGVNELTADFNDVLLWDSPIQRLIDSEVEFGNNLQPHSTEFNGLNVTAKLPSGEFSNITLRTSVDNSSRYSQITDQYPL